MARAAMICFSHYPIDVRVRREAEAVLEAGFEVDVIALRAEDEARRDEYRGVGIHRISLKRLRASKSRYFFEYIFFIFAAGWKMLLLHLKNRYDVIHVHNLPNILVLSAMGPKLMGARVILDMHELMPDFFMRKYNVGADHTMVKLLRLLERLSVRLVDHVIVATPFLERTIARRCAASGKITTILNLPDTRYFTKSVRRRDEDRSPRDAAPRETQVPRPFRIIYPGTLTYLHGVDLPIRAVKETLGKSKVPIELHIYGAGSKSERDYLSALIDRLKLHDQVFMHPQVTLEEIIAVARTMDAGIVPKRNGVFIGEAFSVKLFEFAALGLPALVSRTPGDSYFFDDTMVLFFEPDNVDDLARRMIEIAGDEPLRRRLPRNAATVLERVNWDLVKEELWGIYARLSDTLRPGLATGRTSIRLLG